MIANSGGPVAPSVDAKAPARSMASATGTGPYRSEFRIPMIVKGHRRGSSPGSMRSSACSSCARLSIQRHLERKTAARACAAAI